MHKPSASLLIIDDDDVVRESLAAYLEDSGFTVLQATNGQQGLQVFEHELPDLVICDLRMPRFSGSELYQWLSRHRPEAVTRFIFSSGDVLSQDSTDFLKATRRTVLPKPFELEELGRLADEISRAAHAA